MSAKPTVWISRKLSDNTVARARRDYDVIVNEEDRVYGPDEIIEMSARCDAILPCHSELFNADVAGRLSDRVKVIANHSVGVDHCDLAALKGRGIVVTNTPDVLSDATAEIAMLLLLGAARRAAEGDHMVRTGQWSVWSPSFMVGTQVTGKRIGIVGMGRVGQVMARRARGFDMEVHYHNRTRLAPELEQGALFHETLEGLLAQSEFLSLHCPATPESTGMMNAERFAQMPDGAIIVNTARGALWWKTTSWRRSRQASSLPPASTVRLRARRQSGLRRSPEHLHAAAHRQCHAGDPRRHGLPRTR